jgi:hypothetical protein
MRFRNQKSERELQIKTPNIFLYKGKNLMKMGGVMDSRYFFEER